MKTSVETLIYGAKTAPISSSDDSKGGKNKIKLEINLKKRMNAQVYVCEYGKGITLREVFKEVQNNPNKPLTTLITLQ